MKKSVLFLLILPFLIITCREENEVPQPTSGFFTMRQIGALPGGRTVQSTAIDAQFQLGDLKASKEFYFLLGNGGDSPITDVSLEFDHPGFTVTPSFIGEIGGSSSSAMVPLIAVGVVHGIQLNGVGLTDLLAPGEHQGTMTVTGNTLKDGLIVGVQSVFKFVTHVKEASVQLMRDDIEVDLLSPDGYATGLPFSAGIPTMRIYEFQSDTFVIKNTGNIEVKVVAKSTLDPERPQQEAVLSPGHSTEMHFETDIDGFPGLKEMLISIDSDGTVSDYRKFDTGIDGKIYFLLL